MRGKGGRNPLRKIFVPPGGMCWTYSLKLLDTVQKFWAPLRKLFAPPGVPRWLRACWCDSSSELQRVTGRLLQTFGV